MRMEFMDWKMDKYKAKKGSVIKEYVSIAIILFPEFIISVMFQKHQCKDELTRNLEQAKHFDGVLIMFQRIVWRQYQKSSHEKG